MARQSTQPVQSLWWFELGDADQDRVSATLFTYVQDLQRRQAQRHLGDLENLRIYGQPWSSPYMAAESFTRPTEANVYNNATKVTMSLGQACLDTLTSKLSKNQPRPYFVTEGGDYKSQRLAKNLQAFSDAVFYESRAYELTLRSFVDSGIFGTGLIHAFEDHDGRIGAERVYPYELLIDDADALYGEPQNIYRVKYFDRHRLIAAFPELEDEINQAQSLRQPDGQLMSTRSTRIQVIEAWHLPSAHGEGDGKHMICISNAILFDEEWKRDTFPFAQMRYTPKQNGWWGQGLMEILSPLQTEMNTLLRKIQICMHFLAVPHWLKNATSNIQFGAFNNQIGSVINYTGVEPELKIWQSVPPECFQHVNWLYEKAFEISGISQLSASSKMPGYGQMSGAAMREYTDVESDRFMALGEAWHQFHVDLATLFVDTAKDIASNHGGKYSVLMTEKSVSGRVRRLETIDWKDINLGDSAYQIRCQPVSKFPRSVAGMMQTGQEMVQSGLMPKEMFLDMMGLPDLTAELSLEAAGRELIHKIVAKILDDEKYQAPDPYMDLAYAMKYGVYMLNQALSDEIEEDKVEMLRTWISEIDDIQSGAIAAMQSQNPMQTGQPPPQPLAAAPGASAQPAAQ